jgi:hypothetical protein
LDNLDVKRSKIFGKHKRLGHGNLQSIMLAEFVSARLTLL